MEALGRTCSLVLDTTYNEDSVRALLLLPKIGMAKWAGKEWRAMAKNVLGQYPLLSQELRSRIFADQEPQPQHSDPPDPELSRTRAVRRLMKEGHLRKAARCLLSDGTLRLDATGLQTLRDLHPEPTNTTTPFTGQVPHPPIDNLTLELLEETVKKLPADSAPGPSGWTFAMIRECWEAVPRFRDVLEGLGRLMVKGGESFPARDWLCASRLIPIKKKPSGVRPIACGEAFTRVACRWALATVTPEDILLPEQFGVGSPGGVEPVVWSAGDAIAQENCKGFLKIDFSNAFNTVSRHQISKTVRERVPSLYRLVKLLYNTPSPLLVAYEGGAETLWSRTGVRQGDPLGPLLFSVAIKPLVEKLKADYAVGGRIWAYLDDIFLEVETEDKAKEVIEFLGSQDVASTYGLRVNPAKCTFIAGNTLRDEGCEVLGSWIGGPDNNTNQGAQLGRDAAGRLSERVEGLDTLSLQERLILLRWCFFPTMVHLLRSQHPDVSKDGAVAIDLEVERSLERWVGALSATAKVVAHLPTRLGGLGLFRQEALSTIAAGSSFVLSQGVLNSRAMPLSVLQIDRMRPCVQLCADNLDMPVETLTSEDEWKNPHMQRRAAEVMHERVWKALFNSLELEDRRRLVEASMPLARAWLHSLPTSNPTTLRDVEVRYALHRTLLFTLHAEPNSAVCSKCNSRHDALHHLSCSSTKSIRTNRHNTVRRALAQALRQTTGTVQEERTEGGLRHDILLSDGELGKKFVDVGITTTSATPVGPISWPSAEEVVEALAAEKRQPPQEPDLFWETHRSEPHHRDSDSIRVFRKLCGDKLVHTRLAHMCTVKRNHFQQGYTQAPGTPNSTFIPFVLSAAGGVSKEATELLRDAMLTKHKAGERAKFKKFIYGRLSVTLIKYATMMAQSLNDWAIREP